MMIQNKLTNKSAIYKILWVACDKHMMTCYANENYTHII